MLLVRGIAMGTFYASCMDLFSSSSSWVVHCNNHRPDHSVDSFFAPVGSLMGCIVSILQSYTTLNAQPLRSKLLRLLYLFLDQVLQCFCTCCNQADSCSSWGSCLPVDEVLPTGNLLHHSLLVRQSGRCCGVLRRSMKYQSIGRGPPCSISNISKRCIEFHESHS